MIKDNPAASLATQKEQRLSSPKWLERIEKIGCLTVAGINNLFQKIRNDTKIEKLTPHVLRHILPYKKRLLSRKPGKAKAFRLLRIKL
jgi:site-specific recombinase XerD